MRKKFKRILVSIVFLLVIFISLGFLYNKYYGYIKSGSDIKISGPLSINYINGNKVFINTKKEMKISVTNSGDEDIYYYIEFVNVKNLKKEVEYTLTSNNGLKINDTLNNYNSIISSYIKISSGEEQNYTISFECNKLLLYSLEVNIETEVEDDNYFSEVILKNNKIKKESKTEVGKEIATSDEGLIESTDDYGTTYYFRGNVANNNVKINDHMFKIVRINGDGTVKLIAAESTLDSKKYYESGESIVFNETNIPIFLTNWLNDTLGKSSSLVSTQKFCNDNVKKGDNYLALNRLSKDYIPSFVCLGSKEALKVGLLTADEAIYAGGVVGIDNTSYYLYEQSNENGYYLMTGGKLDNGVNYYPFSISSTGNVNVNDIGTSVKRIKPVININKMAKVTGDGTIDDPYELTE